MTDEYRSVTKFTKERTDNGVGSRIPPQANFLAAVNYLRDFFENKKFLYGIAGGLEMLCLGYRREMPDVHIVYDDKDYGHEANCNSVTLPDGMNPLFPFKILVRTGPAYRDLGCHEMAIIEVNMVPPGSCGSPVSGTLSKNLISLSLKKDGQLKTYKSLNMLYLVQTMLHLCIARDLAWDPRKDIHFLCQNYSTQVQAVREKLDKKLVQRNFLGTALFSRLPREDQCNCYQVLLGKEPPPTMSISPPAPQYSHGRSVSDIAMPKPQLNSRHSAPQMSKQVASVLLTPPLVGQTKSMPGDSLIAGLEPTETTTLPDSLDPKRESRSRYRSASKMNYTHNNIERRPLLQSMQYPFPAPDIIPGKALANIMPMTGTQNRSEKPGTLIPKQNDDTYHLDDATRDYKKGFPHEMQHEHHLGDVNLVTPEGQFITLEGPGPSSHLTLPTLATSLQSGTEAFELDAMSHVHETIARLSGEIEAVLQLEDSTLPKPQHYLEELFYAKVAQQHQVEPCLPNPESTPRRSLPTSLMVGRGTARRPHIQAMSSDESQYRSSLHTGAVETNALGHSHYYSLPPSVWSSQASSTKITPTSSTVYKAYQPTVLPLSSLSANFASQPRQVTSFGGPTDVDDAQRYYQTHSQNRNHQPHTSAWQDASVLAQAYQADLPRFEDGYGANA
ncbi:hypothetical protein T440DRAFT_513650 [Plenodomus tracheiphilus IPT5]|uniref:Uncharacterized protein n=1 Tax=Plenodomus tracheiphilus IPT5 TaxID=1408161 RepID=A0A6A7BJA5_9PLEO|nr:hypothetical protein T440DRAFT_513650 [Plenodomus tracheiphilus IPT5]